MSTYRTFALGILTATLVSASVFGQSPPIQVKRSDGIVAGVDNSTSYYYNLTETSQQCPTLLAADLQTSLEEFDALFPQQLVKMACCGEKPPLMYTQVRCWRPRILGDWRFVSELSGGHICV